MPLLDYQSAVEVGVQKTNFVKFQWSHQQEKQDMETITHQWSVPLSAVKSMLSKSADWPPLGQESTV